jgi:hypothetical protein
MIYLYTQTHGNTRLTYLGKLPRQIHPGFRVS